MTRGVGLAIVLSSLDAARRVHELSDVCCRGGPRGAPRDVPYLASRSNKDRAGRALSAVGQTYVVVVLAVGVICRQQRPMGLWPLPCGRDTSPILLSCRLWTRLLARLPPSLPTRLSTGATCPQGALLIL